MTSVSGVRYSELVQREAPRRIRAYLAARDDWNTVRDLTSMSLKVAHEYRRRFVIELLQNAYDAHPADTRDGFVHFRLDKNAGPHGTLYVANDGRPFSEANFEALTNLSRSNKPPGEGIGNKGIGFRSVLEVCAWPEVYSCAPDSTNSEEFDGLCFRFAGDADIRRLTDTDEEFEAVRSDISSYFLPVPAESSEAELQRLRQLGAVTVVRLPLRDEQSFQVAEDRLRDLVGRSSPVALFLERLARVVVEFANEGDDETHELTRQHTLLEGSSSAEVELAEVGCGEQRYLVATRRLRRQDLMPAIEESIQANALDESWLQWSGDADVSVAVPIDDGHSGDDPGLLYTYLPMEADSPFHGHLNAPFFTKLARTQARIEDVPFNSFLLDTAADLSLTAAQLLSSSELSYRARCTVDLIAWNEELDRLRRAAETRGTPLEELPVVPVTTVAGGLEWEPLAASYDWLFEGEQLSTQHFALLDLPLVHPSLGAARRRRLHDLHEALLERLMEPTPEELADWVEDWAEHLHAGESGPEDWSTLYRELVDVFPGTTGTTLQGRKILIDQGGRLRRAGPPEPKRTTVFLAPRSRSDESDIEAIEVPARLRTAVTYLHSAVPLLKLEGASPKRTEVAEWLERCALAERFDRQSLLAHVARLAARSDIADSTRLEALRWAYKLHAASRDGLTNLARLNLPVPTSAGWRPAPTATFGAGWPGTLGEHLERLLTLTGDVPALAAIGSSLLLTPTDWPIAIEDPASWVDFLREIGVKDGLWPRRISTPQQQRPGNDWNPTLMASQVDLPPEVGRRWVADVNRTWKRDIWHPQTSYYGRGSLWMLPAQDVIEGLGIEARSAYALLVLQSAERWPTEALTYTFQLRQNHPSGANTQSWPTPVSTFLRRAAWFPMADPGNRDGLSFMQPNEAWHFGGADGELPPRFAPLCPRQHQMVLQKSAPATRLLRSYGLRLWDAPEFAAQRLQTIAGLVDRGRVRESDVASVRKACRTAWRELTERNAELSSNVPLIATVGGRLEVVEAAPDGPPVYVADQPSELVASLLEVLERPLLIADGRQGARVAGLLASSGRHVIATSEVAAEIRADGVVVDPRSSPGQELVADVASWLPAVVAPVLQQQQSFVHATEASIQQSIVRLRRLRLVRTELIGVSVDDEAVAMDALHRRVIHVDHETAPVIVVSGDSTEPFSWRWLARISADLCELIGRADSADRLRAAALALHDTMGATWTLPSVEQLADALETSPRRIQEVWQAAAGQVDHLLPLVTVEVALRCDLRAAEALTHVAPADREDLVRHLKAFLPAGSDAEELVLRAERVTSTAEHWEAVGLPLRRYNEALRGLSRPTLHFPERHRTALEAYLATHRDQMLDALRQAFLPAFRSKGDLSDYVRLRSFAELVPDASWLEEYADPPETVIASHAQAWLESATSRRSSGTVASLRSLLSVRTHNDDLADHVIVAARPVVTAWALHHDTEPTHQWTSNAVLRGALHEVGAMDFEQLDETDLIEWLKVADLWPSGMPATRDLQILGLPEDALHEGVQQAQRAKIDRERVRRQIRIGQREFDATEDGYRDIAKAVAEELAAADKSWLHRFAPLSPIFDKRSTSSEGGSPKPKGRRVVNQMSDEQRSAVGLIGEVAAYQWLLANYETANDDSWVSGYRQHVLGGSEGDDSLGYDFVVHTKNRQYLFEVKATPGDGTEFELGTSQIAAARAARAESYRILFVRYALDADLRELHMLPNPFEPKNRQLFAETNQGLRLAFRLAK